MPQTLPAARLEFIAVMKRETSTTEYPRFLAVLDAMIEWSLARPTMVKFRPDESENGKVAFERVGSKVVFWTATPRKHDRQRLELLPRAARLLSEDDRANATLTLNTHSREELTVEDPLRIGFGALKNQAARAAVFDCMDQLLVVT